MIVFKTMIILASIRYRLYKIVMIKHQNRIWAFIIYNQHQSDGLYRIVMTTINRIWAFLNYNQHQSVMGFIQLLWQASTGYGLPPQSPQFRFLLLVTTPPWSDCFFGNPPPPLPPPTIHRRHRRRRGGESIGIEKMLRVAGKRLSSLPWRAPVTSFLAKDPLNTAAPPSLPNPVFQYSPSLFPFAFRGSPLSFSFRASESDPVFPIAFAFSFFCSFSQNVCLDHICCSIKLLFFPNSLII